MNKRKTSMSKSEPFKTSREGGDRPRSDRGNPAAAAGSSWIPSAVSIRETIESVVIAFVLAFLFRTFEAEAFVIPTGSMAPTLLGRHKDVICPKCGYEYQVSASSEVLPTGAPDEEHGPVEGGTCPMCRYAVNMGPDNPQGRSYPSYNGDRILVGKFFYQFWDPKRWDVAVFKFPGEAKTNYIKRIVGLPSETVLIKEGDLFIRRPGDAEFKIARKTTENPRKLLAMLQPVYDNDYPASDLDAYGWPQRWQPTSQKKTGDWQAADDHRSFTTNGQGGAHWLRYQHFTPSYAEWQKILRRLPLESEPQPQWITDFCGYNTGRGRAAVERNFDPDFHNLPQNWVGDLAVECQLEVGSDQGMIVLELVKAGRHFTCRINLANGEAQMAIAGTDFHAAATTPVKGRNTYNLMFSNVDDELLFWVDRKVVPLRPQTTYPRLPKNEPQPDDLVPVGIGCDGAQVTVRHLKIFRDIYYVPQKGGSHGGQYEFPLRADQFLVFGDNSPASKDSRLWESESEYPGGPSLDYFVPRELLIGKALFIYWPHSFDEIRAGTWEIPFPFFPNVARMRPVR